jgi:hypothetical protein
MPCQERRCGFFSTGRHLYSGPVVSFEPIDVPLYFSALRDRHEPVVQAWRQARPLHARLFLLTGIAFSILTPLARTNSKRVDDGLRGRDGVWPGKVSGDRQYLRVFPGAVHDINVKC